MFYGLLFTNYTQLVMLLLCVLLSHFRAALKTWQIILTVHFHMSSDAARERVPEQGLMKSK